MGQEEWELVPLRAQSLWGRAAQEEHVLGTDAAEHPIGATARGCQQTALTAKSSSFLKGDPSGIFP